MKIKHILVIFILGFMITSLGALFKLESWPYASELLIIGLPMKVLAGLLLIVKLLLNKADKTLNY
jgi:hypothetical protein